MTSCKASLSTVCQTQVPVESCRYDLNGYQATAQKRHFCKAKPSKHLETICKLKWLEVGATASEMFEATAAYPVVTPSNPFVESK